MFDGWQCQLVVVVVDQKARFACKESGLESKKVCCFMEADASRWRGEGGGCQWGG
jgi:hypothetical protein